MNRELYAQFPALAALMKQADDLHVITFTSNMQMREFLASIMSYMPGWMLFLYRIRKCFVALLGISQDGIPQQEDIRPQDLSFMPGDKAGMFTVVAAQEDRYWLAQAQDEIITGYVGVVVEAQGQDMRRFHFISGATWRGWKGRVYYKVILPIHHLVVRCMLKHAQKCNARTIPAV